MADKNPVYVVTDVGPSIELAVARRFASQGCRLALLARLHKLERYAAEFVAGGAA